MYPTAVLAALLTHIASPLIQLNPVYAVYVIINTTLFTTILAVWNTHESVQDSILSSVAGAWNLAVYLPIGPPIVLMMWKGNTAVRSHAVFWCAWAIVFAVCQAIEDAIPVNAALCSQGVFCGVIQWALEHNATSEDREGEKNLLKEALENSEFADEKNVSVDIESKENDEDAVKAAIPSVKDTEIAEFVISSNDSVSIQVSPTLQDNDCEPAMTHLSNTDQSSVAGNDGFLKSDQGNEKRNSVIDEIMNTEQSYVKKLTVLVEHFVIPLSTMAEQGLLEQTKEEIQSLFKGILAIQKFHVMFLEKLHKNPSYGKVFKECAQFLKMYTGKLFA
jgi:hypothetical protein